MKTNVLSLTFLASGIVWSASGQTVAPAPPTAPAGTVRVQPGVQQNTVINGAAGTTIQGDPNPGGLHKREEFPNVIIPGEVRRTMPDGTVVVGTNGVPPTNQFVVSSNGVPGATGQFTFNPNRFNFPLSRTNDAGVAATRPAVFQDSAATREDQVLLIQLRRSISTELQAVATTTAPGGNTITPPVHLVINNGVVRVVGTVPAANTRERILMLVQRSPGVTQVVDELQVNATGMTDASVTSASAAGAQNVGTANQTALTAGANGVTNNLPPTSMRTNSSVFANTNQFHHGPILPPTSRTGLPPGLQDRPLPPGLEMQRTNGTPNNP